MGYFEFRKTAVSCRHCGWSGHGRDAELQLESLDVIEHLCPGCHAQLGASAPPTVEESRANLEELTPDERAQLETTERKHSAYLNAVLQRPSQLPDLDGDALELTWDLADTGRGKEDYDVVIRHGDVEVWREPTYFESYRRFGEIAALLSARYGPRLKDLAPTPRSELFLYGDRIRSVWDIQELRARLRAR